MKPDPFNITFLDINKVIKDENLKEVTSEFIRESSTNRFHPEGLFSEEIFGEIASQRRLERCGYIKLNCRVFHPIIFQNLQSIKRFYVEIMAGNSYAVWDSDAGDFVRASESERGASTGFAFFLKYFDSIDFQKNMSLKRNDKIDVISKFKNLRLIDKMIVIPAGVRDLKEDQGRMEKDSINTIYASLLRNAKSMTRGADTNPLYDSVHYTIQKRVVEIYEKVAEIIRGKRGFLEGRYSHRNIARGTRNVITASDMDAASPDSPQYHKIDETKVPLFQAAKAGANQIIYWYKTLFYDQVVNMSSENVPLINQKTLHLEYVPIELKDKDRMLTAEGIEKTIDRFRDPSYRFRPVTVKTNDSSYYLFMVYDRGDRVHIIRNVEEFKKQYTEAGNTWDDKCLRPITQCEMLYIASYFTYKGTHATVTRYPIEDEQSIFISKTHLVTTSPARVVRFMQGIEDSPDDQILPEYPIAGNSFIDVLMLHPTRLKSLKADFDGNCLVGETRIEVRFTKSWLKTCRELFKKLKNTTDQDVEAALDRISKTVYKSDKTHKYAEIKLQDVPQIGEHTVDKNGARVWDVPDGLEVLSYDGTSPTYEDVEKVTVEDDCDVAQIKCGGRTAIVSTNRSLAVFDDSDGTLKKVSPFDIETQLTPFIKKAAPTRGAKDGVFVTGYEMALVLKKLSDIDSLELRKYGQVVQRGYLSGIIDRFGTIVNESVGAGFCIKFEGADEQDEEAMTRLLYVLGLRFRHVCCKGELAVIIDSNDLHDMAADTPLRLTKPYNVKGYSAWAREYKRLHNDIIPITEKECNAFTSPAGLQKIGMHVAVHAVKNKCIDRELAKVCVDKGDLQYKALRARADASDVCWSFTSVTKLNEKRRVYDLIVPKTKVFAVNDGLIVFDTCSWIPIFSEEANKEDENYLHTPGNYILPSGDLLSGMCDDLVQISFFALSRDTPELKK